MSDAGEGNAAVPVANKSFGRSTFKSSYLGASAHKDSEADLGLLSDDEEEENHAGLGASKKSPSFFSAGGGGGGGDLATQIDTQLDIDAVDGADESQTQTQVQVPTKPSGQDDDAMQMSDAEAEADGDGDDESAATRPVVYNTSGKMKVLGALPANIVASLQNKSTGRKSSKPKSQPKSTSRVGSVPLGKMRKTPALMQSLAEEAAAAAAASSAAAASVSAPSPVPVRPLAPTSVASLVRNKAPLVDPNQIRHAVRAIAEESGELCEQWTRKQWREEVCLQLDIEPSDDHGGLRDVIDQTVFSFMETFVASQFQSQSQSQNQTQAQSQSQTTFIAASSQEALLSQADELFGNLDAGNDLDSDSDNDDDDAAATGETVMGRWADVKDDDDDDEIFNDVTLGSSEKKDAGSHYWGEESDDEDVFSSKKSKKAKAKAKADAAKIAKKQEKAKRREEKERRRAEVAARKAAKAAKKARKEAGEEEGHASGFEAGASDKGDDSESDADSNPPSSPESSDNDAEDDEYEAGPSKKSKTKGDKSKSKSKGKTPKADEAAPVPSGPTALETEIAAIQALDQGPSEAELRTRRLVSLEEEERIELVYRMNQKAALVMSMTQGRSLEQECRELREIKQWINMQRARGDERIIEEIEEALDKHVTDMDRKYGAKYTAQTADRYGKVDPIFFLKRSTEADDEEENEDLHHVEPTEPEVDPDDEAEDNEQKQVGAGADNVDNDAMVALSDSEGEDEDEGEGEGDVETQTQRPADVGIMTVVKSTVEVSTTDNDLTPLPLMQSITHKPTDVLLFQREKEEERMRRERIRAAMMAVRAAKPGSKRTQEKQRLLQHVAVRAKEEYCQRLRISTDHLPLKQQIFESCRKIVDLLRERADRQQERLSIREAREQERRRRIQQKKFQQWLREKNADEAEFDDGAEIGMGRQYTEEEMAMLKAEMEADVEEEDEDEDQDYDEEAGDYGATLTALEEERQAVVNSGQADSDNDNDDDDDDPADEDDAGVEEEADGAEGDDAPSSSYNPSAAAAQDGEEDEDEVVPRARKTKRRNAVDDDDEDEVAGPTAGSATQGTDATARPQNEQAEQPATGGKERRRRGNNNSLYRQMVEEEERRDRSRKKSTFLDAEAEEDEEAEGQRGLGDFGFGTGAKDNEDERDALKLRKGDFEGIVDNLSDDEIDEADEENAMRMRKEQELKDDLEQRKRLIEGIVDGFDKTKRGARKGQMSFDKLVVDASRREAEAALGGGPVEDLDEEEVLQRMLTEGITSREQWRRANGMLSDESGDDEDDEDDGLLPEDDGTLSEEQRAAQLALLERKREDRRQEKLRRRNLENAARIERNRRKMRAQAQSQSQSQTQQFQSQTQTQTQFASFQSSKPALLRRNPTLTLGLGIDEDDVVPAPVSLKRFLSSGGMAAPVAALPSLSSSSSFSSSALASAPTEQAAAAATAAAQGDSQMQPADDESQSEFPTKAKQADSDSQPQPLPLQQQESQSQSQSSTLYDGDSQPPLVDSESQLQTLVAEESQSQAPTKLRNVTNTLGVAGESQSQFQLPVKRRTGLPPKRLEVKPRPSTAAPAAAGPVQPIKRIKTTQYSGELNANEVEAGFGMGMAVPALRRKTTTEGGLFSVVTGLKRVDSGVGVGGAIRTHSNALKKHRSGGGGGTVTVTGQQYVFGAASSNFGGGGGGLDEGSQLAHSNMADRSFGAGVSSSGVWDKAGAAMNSRMAAPAGGLSKQPSLSRSSSGPGLDDKSSLFAKLKR